MSRSDNAIRSSEKKPNTEGTLNLPTGSDFVSIPVLATPEQAFELSLRLIAKRFGDPRAEEERRKKRIDVPFVLKT